MKTFFCLPSLFFALLVIGSPLVSSANILECPKLKSKYSCHVDDAGRGRPGKEFELKIELKSVTSPEQQDIKHYLISAPGFDMEGDIDEVTHQTHHYDSEIYVAKCTTEFFTRILNITQFYSSDFQGLGTARVFKISEFASRDHGKTMSITVETGVKLKGVQSLNSEQTFSCVAKTRE